MLNVILPCAGRGTGSLQPNAASKGTVKKDHRGQPFIIESIPPKAHHTRQSTASALSAETTRPSILPADRPTPVENFPAAVRTRVGDFAERARQKSRATTACPAQGVMCGASL